MPGHWEQCGRKLRVTSRNSEVFKLVLWESLFSGPILKPKQKKLRIGTAFKVIGADWTDSNMRGFVLGRPVLTKKLQTVPPAD